MTDSLPPPDDPQGQLDFGPLADRLGYALRRAQIAVFRHFFKTFEPFDIKPAQYSILTIIERNPGLKQTQVCDALGIKRANFVAMIDELERRGLVRRAAAASDRRSYALVLTAQGESLMPKLHELSGAHEQRLIDALGAERRHEMAQELAALAAQLNEEA